MTRASNDQDQFTRLFPWLKDELRKAQMNADVTSFLYKVMLLSLIVSLNITFVVGLFLFREGLYLAVLPLFIVLLFMLFYVLVHALPKISIAKVRQEIEGDIFIPSRMLLTLLEAGNSLISAIEAVSYTRAASSKYFGKIASEIYLGKNIEQAIDDAIKFTPSDSFRLVLEPIKKSLKTGTDIRKTLLSTLQELQQQKIVEIEQYEKKLNPISMFYMIFGTIVPAIGIVGLVLVMAVLGIRIEFFPTLFILLLLITVIQLAFVNLFKGTRPLVKL